MRIGHGTQRSRPLIFDSSKYHRRSIRLKGYDYAQAGAYFVTICAQDRECIFGEVTGEEMSLNSAGQTALSVWNDLPMRYPHVELDAFVVMPNHVHGIIVLTVEGDANSPVEVGSVGAGFKPAPTPGKRHGLQEIVRAFKTFSARRINELHGTPGRSLWQRNYYEHVIRDEDDLNSIREYIFYNPAKWAFDRENPMAYLDPRALDSPDPYL